MTTTSLKIVQPGLLKHSARRGTTLSSDKPVSFTRLWMQQLFKGKVIAILQNSIMPTIPCWFCSRIRRDVVDSLEGINFEGARHLG
jgi:hypothetical protein